ncbi:MAG: hypothetical protein H5T85_04070 [Actinobacteria bacterium]|nr:hypothetical protein [Actinomycetota bacterium]
MEEKGLNVILNRDDLVNLFDVIQKITRNQELLSWFVTIDRILSKSTLNADLVYKIVERDKQKLYENGICRDMDAYKIMNFVPIVVNTLRYLKENAGMFKDVELKVKSRV